MPNEQLVLTANEPAVITKLLRSRKVWVAAISVLTAIALKLGLPTDIATSVTNLLMVVGTALIGGIALEDGLTNAGQGIPRTAVDGATASPLSQSESPTFTTADDRDTNPDVLTARNT